MLGSALYYPFIDVRDQAWLRSAILFWDKIQTIVPTTITRPYLNSDSKICEAEGYLEPLYCELYPEVLQELGRKVVDLFDRPEWLADLLWHGPQSDPSINALRRSESVQGEISGGFHLVGLYPEKMSPEMKDEIVRVGVGRLHPAKISQELRSVLRGNPGSVDIASRKMSGQLKRMFGYREEYDGDWILVNSNFAAAYMAALAAMLAKKKGVSPLTSQESFQGLNLRFLIDDSAKVSEHQANAALLTIVMESLRVDPATPVSKMLAFRRSRADQLAELSAVFDDLRTKIEKSEDARELKDKAKRVYENKVRPGLEKLKNELQDQAIQSGWKGFYQAATLSTAAGGTLLANVAQSNSLSIFGAGLFLTSVNVAVEAAFAARKARASSPLTYLLDIERKFSLPRY